MGFTGYLILALIVIIVICVVWIKISSSKVKGLKEDLDKKEKECVLVSGQNKILQEKMGDLQTYIANTNEIKEEATEIKTILQDEGKTDEEKDNAFNAYFTNVTNSRKL